MSGRFTGDNTRLVYDILNEAKSSRKRGLIVLVEFEKAFDSVAWSFLNEALQFFNFEENVIEWVNILNKVVVVVVVVVEVVAAAPAVLVVVRVVAVPLPAFAPSLSQVLQAPSPLSQPAPTAPSQPGPGKKKEVCFRMAGRRQTPNIYKRKLKQPAEYESGEMLTLGGDALPCEGADLEQEKTFFSKTHALLYSLLKEQEEEEMAPSQNRETNV
ncbi:reverse transcriptase [Elysia marginata]|uniref:Reverse transcriptase n=1 Tax=Elysia marginata TaxID=1093978 RepID=A0AAV4EI99_9GAST|nr:reverse transcriptase [Elysia marginata]